MKRSLGSLLEELSDLNEIHMGRRESGMTRAYEVGRHRMLVELLEQHRREERVK